VGGRETRKPSKMNEGIKKYSSIAKTQRHGH